MIVNLYAVYDSASGVYDGPVPGVADGKMVQKFSDMSRSAESDIGKHPECYTLFKVGTWNDGTGEAIGCVPEKLINGVEAVAMGKEIVKDLEN